MDDRPKNKRGEEMKNLRSEDADAMLTAEPAEGAGPGPETRSAIGGASGSEAAPGGRGGTGGDAGSPGGMGGVHSRPSGTGRPPGGVSPVQDTEDSAG